MVEIQQTDPQLKRSSPNKKNPLRSWITTGIFLIMVLWTTALASFLLTQRQERQQQVESSSSARGTSASSSSKKEENDFASSCPVTSISSLSDAELHPVVR
jgi:cytoskeletal protein RodZ